MKGELNHEMDEGETEVKEGELGERNPVPLFRGKITLITNEHRDEHTISLREPEI